MAVDISAAGSVATTAGTATSGQGIAPIYSLSADQMTLGASPIANADKSMTPFGVGINTNTYA